MAKEHILLDKANSSAFFATFEAGHLTRIDAFFTKSERHAGQHNAGYTAYH